MPAMTGATASYQHGRTPNEVPSVDYSHQKGAYDCLDDALNYPDGLNDPVGFRGGRRPKAEKEALSNYRRSRVSAEEETFMLFDIIDLEDHVLASVYREDDFTNKVRGMYTLEVRLRHGISCILLVLFRGIPLFALGTFLIVVTLMAALYALGSK